MPTLRTRHCCRELRSLAARFRVSAEAARFRRTSFPDFGLLHALVQLVCLPQQLLLLISQTLQLPFNFVLFFLGFCLFQCRLQLCKLFVQIGLSPRKLFQSIEDLTNLALLLFLLALLRLLLSLVAVLVLLQLQVVQLLLSALLGSTAGTLLLVALLTSHLKLARSQFQQHGVGGLLCRECVSQSRQVRPVDGLFKLGDGDRHVVVSRFDKPRRFFVSDFFRQCFQHPDRIGLRLDDQTDIVLERFTRRFVGSAAEHVPCRSDDLLLQFGEFFGLPRVLTRRTRLTARGGSPSR